MSNNSDRSKNNSSSASNFNYSHSSYSNSNSLRNRRATEHVSVIYRCLKLSNWQFPDDVKFSKKISERFNPEINSDVINNQTIKIDYYRQASKEVAKDSRDFRSLPKPSKEFSKVFFSSNCSHWIRGEPAKHIFIDQISSKQVRTDLNLYALLEDFFQLSENDIVNISLLLPSANSIDSQTDRDRLCASVLFTSGYKAWELLRDFTKNPPANCTWLMSVDPGAKEFERRRRLKLSNEQECRKKNEKEQIYENEYTETSFTARNTQNSFGREFKKVTCSPFVPCLKIPFSCESTFPFRLDENVLLSLFPASRFPSIFGVEEGGSSWHIHFGREIDVVEADRMFQRDVFVWNNHRFYFEKWRLVKGDIAWKIPDHYNKSAKLKLQIGSDLIFEDDNSNNDNGNGNGNGNNNGTVPPTKIDRDGVNSIVDFSSLPKINKKRRIEAFEESANIKPTEDCTNSTHSPLQESEVIDQIVGSESVNKKMKVKRKPLKKRSFIPVPNAVSIPILSSTIETNTQNNSKYDDEDVIVSDVINYPLTLKSGSARTEEYFKLTEEQKRQVKFPGVLEAFSYSSSSSGGGSGGINCINYLNSVSNSNSENTNQFQSQNHVSTGRSSRAQNRRPLSNSMAVDLFKVSPLQSTQKLVALRNSSIHSYGLILMEAAEAGDLIIEYVGELVRASVANIREWLYEREYCGDGIASSYLFRLDDVMVIDASHQGNLARFINHSCEPNCVAKTITLNGSKRIVMYAKKGIRLGEEITYDYKFPTEKDPKKKVKCLCGSSSCRKYLN